MLLPSRNPVRPLRGRYVVAGDSAGRARASATSPRATRGTSARSEPTAERSHCFLNGKQYDDGHDIAYDSRYLWD